MDIPELPRQILIPGIVNDVLPGHEGNIGDSQIHAAVLNLGALETLYLHVSVRVQQG